MTNGTANDVRSSDGQIGVREIRRILRASRTSLLILAGTVVAASIALAVFTRPTYRSQVVLAVSSDKDSGGALSSLIGQFGGLSALAGIDIGLGGSRRDEAIAVLKSRTFTRRFIEAEGLMRILLADRWDAETGKWRRGRFSGREPTLGDAVTKFEVDVRRVSVDEVTGIVTLTVDWHDRVLAAQWANRLVESVDEELRRRAIEEANKSIDYLNAEAQRTSVVQVREAIYRVLESQINTVMLAKVRDDYTFRVLDPAVVADADKFVWPKRPLIIALGLLLSVVLAVAYAYAADAYRRLRIQLSNS